MNKTAIFIKKRHANFLQKIHQHYGDIILGVSMSEIARVTLNTLPTAICYMDRLEEHGYVKIYRITTNKKRIEIDKEKYQELMKEMPTLYK